MKPAPQKYRTTNWKTYNEALKARGSLLIWLDPVMKWHGRPSGKRGRSQTFSDEAIHFLPRLMKCLGEVAPGVTISTVRNTAVNLADELESGRVDLALGLLPQLKAGFFQRLLFRQRYVCLFREGHALDKETMSLQDFEAAQHIVVVAGGTGHAIVDDTIARRGVKRNVRLSVPHFVALGHILSTTDLIATAPERYVREGMAPFKLKYLPHPVPFPEFDVNLFWHARFHKKPGNQWLRNVLAEMAVE